jgi:basic membrane protein A
MSKTLRIQLAIFSTALLLQGCQLSDEDLVATALAQTRVVERLILTGIAETEVALITDTPAVTNTPIPIPTPTPRPFTISDLYEVSLELPDLPESYASIPLEEMDLSEELIKSTFLEMDLSVGPIFAYFDEQNFQLVFGWTVFLPSTFERAGFDLETRHPETVLESIMSTDDMRITRKGMISGTEAGDSSIAIFAEWDTDNSPYVFRFDMIVFRRNMVGVFLAKMYVLDEEWTPPIHDLANLLDSKASLATDSGSLTGISKSTEKICLVTDIDGMDDVNYNRTVWKGVERAARAHGIDARVLESITGRDYTPNIRAFVDSDCDLIVTVGFRLAGATLSEARAHPNMNFAIVDYSYSPPVDNIAGQVFAVDQAAFIAGYLSAGMSETGIVATYGGIQIPQVTIFMDGYALGVKHYNSVHSRSVRVLGWDEVQQTGAFTGNFENLQDGYDLAVTFLNQGADIIFPVAGPLGIGSAEAIMDRGKGWILGVDLDWQASYPEYSDVILVSVMKNVDTATYRAIENVLAGRFEGGDYIGTLRNGGVGLSQYGTEIPEWLLDELTDIRFLIERGELATRP